MRYCQTASIYLFHWWNIDVLVVREIRGALDELDQWDGLGGLDK